MHDKGGLLLPAQLWQGYAEEGRGEGAAAPACVDPTDGVHALPEHASLGDAECLEATVAALRMRRRAGEGNSIFDGAAAAAVREQWGGEAAGARTRLADALGEYGGSPEALEHRFFSERTPWPALHRS